MTWTVHLSLVETYFSVCSLLTTTNPFRHRRSQRTRHAYLIKATDVKQEITCLLNCYVCKYNKNSSLYITMFQSMYDMLRVHPAPTIFCPEVSITFSLFLS